MASPWTSACWPKEMSHDFCIPSKIEKVGQGYNIPPYLLTMNLAQLVTAFANYRAEDPVGPRYLTDCM